MSDNRHQGIVWGISTSRDQKGIQTIGAILCKIPTEELDMKDFKVWLYVHYFRGVEILSHVLFDNYLSSIFSR